MNAVDFEVGNRRKATVSPTGSGPAYTASFNWNGRLFSVDRSGAKDVAVQVAAGGFTITVR
jgi:hypothetical protein